MKSRRNLFAAVAVVLAGCHAPDAPTGHWQTKVAWGYEATDGPAVWSTLSPQFALCGRGREQSPLDLGAVAGTAVEDDVPPVSLRIIRHAHEVDVLDTGHTLEVEYDDGSVLQIGDRSYPLLQYHFHAPSEHSVEGRRFPMEVHFVHQSPQGELSVLGVLVEIGAHNPAYDPVRTHLPEREGEEVHLARVSVEIDELLPRNSTFYRYRGSLTTPPCSEDVRWFVAAQPIELSRAQVDAYASIVQGNSRPVQPLGNRRIASGQIDR